MRNLFRRIARRGSSALVLGRHVRLVVLALVVFAAATFASVAAADTYTTYCNYCSLDPGGSQPTPGYNSRDWNDACRTDNSGSMSVGWYNTDGQLVEYDGPKYTYCGLSSVTNDSNGYFLGRCWNTGSVTFTAFCQTHNI